MVNKDYQKLSGCMRGNGYFGGLHQMGNEMKMVGNRWCRITTASISR